jgi:ABC-type glycerol-3-phosphate transport system substrate-binding protein
MVEMDAAGVQPSFANQDPIDNEQNAVWVSGRGGSTYSWISNPNVAAGSYMGGGHQDDIGMAVFPVPAGMTGYPMVRPGMGHSISRNTNHPEAVAYFLNYFYHDEVAVKAVGTMLGIPSAIGAFAILEGQGLIQGHAAMGLDLIISTPTAPMGAFWEDETLRQPRYAIQDALRSGNITVQQAAERFVNEQQAALDLIFR